MGARDGYFLLLKKKKKKVTAEDPNGLLKSHHQAVRTGQQGEPPPTLTPPASAGFAPTAPHSLGVLNPPALQTSLSAPGLQPPPQALGTPSRPVPQACGLKRSPVGASAGPGEIEDVQQGPSSWLHKRSLGTA